MKGCDYSKINKQKDFHVDLRLVYSLSLGTPPPLKDLSGAL